MPATNGTMCYVFDDERCIASGWTRRTSLTYFCQNSRQACREIMRRKRFF